MEVDSKTLNISPIDSIKNNKLLEEIYIDQSKTQKFLKEFGLLEKVNSTSENFILENSNDNQSNKYDHVNEKRLNENFDEKLKDIKNTLIERYEKEYKENLIMKEIISRQSVIEKLESEFGKLENEYSDKFNNELPNFKITDDILTECKSKVRDMKHEKMKKKIEMQIKPNIDKKIYFDKYSNIQENFIKEIDDKYNNEIFLIKMHEIEKIKNNIENIQTNKAKEIEEKCKIVYKKEFEEKMDTELKRREKIIKTSILRKLEFSKKKLENNLKEDFENKKKDLLKEISEIQALNFCKELAKNLKRKEKYSSSSNIHHNNLKKSLSTMTFELIGKNVNNLSIVDDILSIDKYNNVKYQMNRDEYNSVNIKDLNCKLKTIRNNEKTNKISKDSVLMKNNTSKILPVDKQIKNEPEKIIKDENLGQNLIDKNVKDIYESISLIVDDNIPTNMIKFGNFLENFIKNEKNHKHFLENNIQKFTKVIQNKFIKNQMNDHNLVNSIINQWNVLEVSYQVRYKIIKYLINCENILELYNILYKETQFLSDFHEKTQLIYNVIKIREKTKSQIQTKLDRSKINQLILSDEIVNEDIKLFRKNSLELTNLIIESKEKNKLNVIWRGLEYIWVNTLLNLGN